MAQTSGTAAAAADPQELDLLRRLRASDSAAYEQLVRTWGGRMLAVARRLLRNEDDALEAVQDAFLSAFRNLDRFTGQARLGTWLHRIVVNASLMKLRRRRRKPEVSIENLLPAFRDDGHFANPATTWPQPADRLVENEETREFVRNQIDRLPEDYRTVLLLRDIEQLDTQETADILNLTPMAVKTRLHRARIALRTLLDSHLRGGAA